MHLESDATPSRAGATDTGRRAATSVAQPALSVVIPTYQRRASLLRTLESLEACTGVEPVELVVSVDGSTDGTVEALARRTGKSTVRVLAHPNRGAAAARNAGAAAARAPFVLFLDDDMIADPGLLTAHLQRQVDRPAVVLGDLRLHPDSPRSVLTDGMARWCEQRHQRLSSAEPGVQDWLSGQLSVPRQVFLDAGGFDEHFTRRGAFGGEDTDLVFRLQEKGVPVVFAADAVSWQVYTTEPRTNLEQWRSAGSADADLVRRHPQLLPHLKASHTSGSTNDRIFQWLTGSASVRAFSRTVAQRPVLALAERHPGNRLARAAFLGARHAQYWAGAAESGGLTAAPRRVVLTYHSISDRAEGDLAHWTVRPGDLDDQVDALRSEGFALPAPEHFVAGLDGSAELPDRSVLLTFDDAYVDLVEAAQPRLDAHGVAGAVFCVTDHIGKRNSWEQGSSAGSLPLLDRRQLTELRAQGWVIGGHSSAHRHLRQLSGRDLRLDLEACARALRESGDDPRLLAFPYGEHDVRVRQAARAAGFRVVFGVARASEPSGVVPRVEVTADDTPGSVLERVDRAMGLQTRLDRLRLPHVRSEVVGALRAGHDVLEHSRGRAHHGSRRGERAEV